MGRLSTTECTYLPTTYLRVRVSLYDRGGGGNGPGRTYAMGVVEQE